MTGEELKGIVKTEHLKGEKVYTLEYSMNALIELEKKFGSVQAAFDSMKENVGLSDLRMLVYAGLFEHHELTEKEVGRIIDMNKIDKLFEDVEKALEYGLGNSDKKK